MAGNAAVRPHASFGDSGAGHYPRLPAITLGPCRLHAPSSLFDVASGSNGTCPTAQWCTARSGWDGPTGLGTPNGTGGF